MVDRPTKRWIRNASDELAVAAGCRFDEQRGQFVLDWWEKYLRLYEGDAWAGKPLTAMDWQIETTMRMYGWIRHSERWSRIYGRETWIRRFNQAVIFIPKKQGKSPTLAAHGLYLLCGDGEQGQKVFLCARDGTQARDIAGKHALEMLKQSDELMAECTINKSLMQITHEPTRSILKPLATADERSQQSKEGLNGCILVDEVHVVDRRLMKRVSRAGISRAEPFQIEVSTAGNNPDSYGKSRYDYCKQIERGEVEDQRLFFACWEAPQDLTDEQLAEHPTKYGKLANPAWGQTVDKEEFVSDYASSKQSTSELADFKMYRLNVWQKSANPWLQMGDWDACYSEVPLADFRGDTCHMGLDKSKTRDMTAVVLVFRDGDDFYQYPFFWLPEATARRHRDDVAFLQWAEQGHLELIPGEVIQDQFIEERVAELAGQFRIQDVIFDRTFAEDITQVFEQELGIERVDFPQTSQRYAGPIEDYERLIIQHSLHHNGHPVLSWQAGHCQVKADAKGRKLLVKPDREDIKKIDGMVAGVMALQGALTTAGPSIYSTYGNMTLEGPADEEDQVADRPNIGPGVDVW